MATVSKNKGIWYTVGVADPPDPNGPHKRQHRRLEGAFTDISLGSLYVYSDDGGQTWTKIPFPSPTTWYLNCIDAYQTSRWVLSWPSQFPVAQNLYLFYSTDNGFHWVSKDTGFEAGTDGDCLLEAVGMAEAVIWATSTGNLYYTDDAGDTWTEISHPSPLIYGTHWATLNKGWVIGYRDDYGAHVIYYTENGGSSWAIQWDSSVDDTPSWLMFQFQKIKGRGDIVYAITHTQYDTMRILCTLDGGENWSSVHTTTLEAEYGTYHTSHDWALLQLPQGSDATQARIMTRMFNGAEDHYWYIISTDDAGATWSESKVIAQDQIVSITWFTACRQQMWVSTVAARAFPPGEVSGTSYTEIWWSGFDWRPADRKFNLMYTDVDYDYYEKLILGEVLPNAVLPITNDVLEETVGYQCYGYIFCGRNGSDFTDYNYQSHRYSWDTNSWSETAYAEPGPLVWKTTGFTVWDSQAFRIGGQNVYGDLVSGIHKYRYSYADWRTYATGTDNIAECYHFSTSTTACFYGGGFTQTTHTDPDLLVSDAHYQFAVLGLGLIVTRTSKPADAAGYSAACAVDGTGYVASGHDELAAVTKLYSYNPSTHVWTALTDPTASSSYPSGFGASTSAVMLLQVDDGAYTYEPISDNWTTLSLTPSLQDIEAAANVGWGRETSGYIAGGGDVAGATAVTNLQYIDLLVSTITAATACPMAGVAMGGFVICYNESGDLPYQFGMGWDIKADASASLQPKYDIWLLYDHYGRLDLPYDIDAAATRNLKMRYHIDAISIQDYFSVYYDIRVSEDFPIKYNVGSIAVLDITYDIAGFVHNYFTTYYNILAQRNFLIRYDIGPWVHFPMKYHIGMTEVLSIEYDIAGFVGNYFTTHYDINMSQANFPMYYEINNYRNFPMKYKVRAIIANSYNCIGVIVGGKTGGNPLDFSYQAQFYTESTDSWSLGGDAEPAPLVWYASGANVRDRGYRIGGIDIYGDIVDVTSEYIEGTNIWSRRLDIPQPKSSAATFSIGENIYATSGRAQTKHTGSVFLSDDTYRYTPKSNTWNNVTSILTARYHAAAFAYDSKGYVIGGTGAAATDNNQSYNPTTNSWTVLTAIPSTVDFPTGMSTTEFNRGYVQHEDDLYRYGIPGDSWTVLLAHYSTTFYRAGYQGWSADGSTSGYIVTGGPDASTPSTTNRELNFIVEVGSIKTAAINAVVAAAGFFICPGFPIIYHIFSPPLNFRIKYDVGVISTPSANLPMTYDLTLSPLVMRYDIRAQSPEKELPLYYDIRLPENGFRLSYDINGFVSDSLDISYDIVVSTDFSMSYSIGTSTILHMYYNVGDHGVWVEFEPESSESQSHAIYYDIAGPSGVGLTTSYDINRPQWSSLLMRYHLSGYYDYFGYYTQVSMGLPVYSILGEPTEVFGADGQVALGQPLVVRARILHGGPTTHRDSGTPGYTNPLYNLSVVWRLDSRDKNNRQTAYQVQVDKSSNFDTTWLLDSGLVVSTDQIYRAGQAKLFDDATRYWARVRVRDRYNVWSDWEVTCYP